MLNILHRTIGVWFTVQINANTGCRILRGGGGGGGGGGGARSCVDMKRAGVLNGGNGVSHCTYKGRTRKDTHYTHFWLPERVVLKRE